MASDPTQPPQQAPAHEVAPALPTISNETIRDLVGIQSRELEVRAMEIAQRNKELDHNAAHAHRILDAQKEDRVDQRATWYKHRRDLIIGSVVVALAVICFAIYGLSSGNGTIVKDILQIVISAALGGAGGYGLGQKNKTAPPKADAD